MSEWSLVPATHTSPKPSNLSRIRTQMSLCQIVGSTMTGINNVVLRRSRVTGAPTPSLPPHRSLIIISLILILTQAGKPSDRSPDRTFVCCYCWQPHANICEGVTQFANGVRFHHLLMRYDALNRRRDVLYRMGRMLCLVTKTSISYLITLFTGRFTIAVM